MKKLFPISLALTLALSACGIAGMNAQPTSVPVPTAAPTQAVTINPTLPADNGQPGGERTAAGDGMVQVYVPAGEFQAGGFDGDAQNDEHPTHTVKMDAFWIDKLEVTNAMYKLCVTAGACQPPRDVKSSTHPDYYENTTYADYPVIYVNWNDAANYCKWAGRQLPTEAQWEYAARGSADTRRYPWGEQSPDNNLANYDYQQNRDTTRVGSFPKGASPFGALDMAGNVWEWMADFYNANFYNLPESLDPNPFYNKGTDGALRALRGGSWADNFKELRVSNRGFAKEPDLTADSKSEAYQGESNDRTGFRCAAPGK